MQATTSPEVITLSQPGEQWMIELDRARQQLLINVDMLPASDDWRTQVVNVGFEVSTFLMAHPNATDDELTVVAISAA